MDKWTRDWIKAIKKCKDDDDLAIIIDKIYVDGFVDGSNRCNHHFI